MISYFELSAADCRYVYSSGDGTLYSYPVNASNGLPLQTPVTTTPNFDVRSRPYYSSATSAPAWSSFFDLLISPGNPSFSYAVPVFNSSDQSLLCVVSVFRRLSMFTSMLAVYAARNDVSFIMDDKFNLIATSQGESGWVSASASLKFALSSSNGLVRDVATFLKVNAITYDNTFTMYSSSGAVLFVSVVDWKDSSGSLSWLVVAVDIYSSGSPTPAPTAAAAGSSAGVKSADVVVAKEGAEAAAVLAALTLLTLCGFILYVCIRAQGYRKDDLLNMAAPS